MSGIWIQKASPWNSLRTGSLLFCFKCRKSEIVENNHDRKGRTVWRGWEKIGKNTTRRVEGNIQVEKTV